MASLPGDDLVLCQITRKEHRDPYTIPLLQGDFESGRLTVDSFIRSHRLFTVEQSVILYAAGRVKNAKLQEVKAAIRQLFS